MSFLGRLLRSTPFDNPQVPLSSGNVAYFLDLFGGGRTDSNEIVTPLTSLQLATAFGCVRLLSHQIATSPLWVYERLGKGKQIARDHYLFDLLTLEPNDEMSKIVLLQVMTAQMLLWGAAYVEIIRDGGGRPVHLWPRGAWKTRPVRRAGKQAFETTDNDEGQIRYIDADNMLYVPYVSLDGQTGLSPIAMVRQTFGQALAMDKFASRFFGNYAKPQLAIKYPGLMKPEDKTKARNDWEALQSGSNQHRVAILDAGADVKELTMPLEDAQFLQSRQFTDTRICGIYGVPPHMMGLDEKGAVKSTVEQKSIEIVQYTLAPILGIFTQEFNRKLLPTTGRGAGHFYIGFDTRDMRLPDAASRQAFYQSMLQNGAMVQNEVRDLEGFNPYAGDLGSQPIVQLNMQPLAALTANTGESTNPAKEIEQSDGLSRLAGAFSPVFRDGLSRFLHRQKRDFAAVHACLGPCLEAISAQFRGDVQMGAASGATMRSILENWLMRSESWAGDAAQMPAVAVELRWAISALAAAAQQDVRAAQAAQLAQPRQQQSEEE